MDFVLKPFRTALRVARLANLHYFEFTPNFETRQDHHSFRELVYVDNGTLTVHGKNFSGSLTKNQMILHGENEEHSLSCPARSAPNVIIIGFECHEPRLDRFSGQPVSLSPSLRKLLAEIITEGRAVFLPPYDTPGLSDMKKRPDPIYGADQMLRNLLETFLIKLIREFDSHAVSPSTTPLRSGLVGEVERYLLQNFREKIKLDELAFLFRTNRTTLCKSFRAELGMSILQYLQRRRIEYAKTLIREGTLNFAQIAEELNLPSQAYFTRLFETWEGLSPRAYISTIKSSLEK